MDRLSIKNYVAKNMKNMQVVNLRNESDKVFASDSRSKAGLSIEDLRKKYLSEDYKPSIKSDNYSQKPPQDEIEVGVIKKKNYGASDNNSGDERTIIGSKHDGIVGSQG